MGVDKDKLNAMYKDATKEPLHFLKIDTEIQDINKALATTSLISIILVMILKEMQLKVNKL